jgi:hypothetical protein
VSGGSFERESARDAQCSNCGRWYDSAGIKSHERNCEHPDDVDPIVPVEDAGDAPDFDELREEIGTDVDEPEDDRDGPDAPDPIGADPSPPESTPSAKTDGGAIRELPTPDESDVDQGRGDDVEETDDVGPPQCPKCGSTRVYPVDDLPDFVTRAKPEIDQFEWVCDDETTLRHGQIEVFNE